MPGWRKIQLIAIPHRVPASWAIKRSFPPVQIFLQTLRLEIGIFSPVVAIVKFSGRILPAKSPFISGQYTNTDTPCWRHQERIRLDPALKHIVRRLECGYRAFRGELLKLRQAQVRHAQR